jgi:hypothetical protein
MLRKETKQRFPGRFRRLRRLNPVKVPEARFPTPQDLAAPR